MSESAACDNGSPVRGRGVLLLIMILSLFAFTFQHQQTCFSSYHPRCLSYRLLRWERIHQCWLGRVIESDFCLHFDDMDPFVDPMTDVSQYIGAPKKLADDRIIDLQGECFSGEQRNLEGWVERTDDSNIVRVKPPKATVRASIRDV
jgi:hypothetical protein